MKTYFILFFLATYWNSFSQNEVRMSIDEPTSCAKLQGETMEFLTNGSLQSAAVVQKEMSRLKACGLDDYDVRFFGRMEALSGLLKKLTQEKLIDQLTYGDLLTAINDMKSTANYTELKRIAKLSQQLAETKADVRNWNKDVALFEELGASKAVQEKVYHYLREHPDNELTYQELLIKLKN